MSIEIRITLLIGALFTMLYFIRHIRKNQMQIDYAIYWALFSGALVFFSFFPGTIEWVAAALHVKSPVNFIYLIIIFLLIIKLFTTTLKLSKLNQQVTELVQYIALKDQEKDKTGKK